MNRFKNYGLRMMLAAALCAPIAPFANAQSTTGGAIGGTVYDSQGAVIPNAHVTIVNNGTGTKTDIVSDSQGFFHSAALQPGDYAVSIASTGFGAYKINHVAVELGLETSIAPKLKIGTAQDSVDVSAEAPLVNTENADFSNNVNQTEIQNLPLNGRRWSNFSLLQPGVVADSNGFGLLSFRGISTLLNNNTFDGADNNQAYFSEERGRTRAAYSTSQFAVQEFQVNTSNYSAEYGRAAGGVVNTVTKSGTNELHGTAAFYDRNNAWGAYNPYVTLTNPATLQSYAYKPTDDRKQWGFGLGGALIKDKLFWFYAYDQQAHNFPGTGKVGSPSTFFATTGNNLNYLASDLKITTAQASPLLQSGLSLFAQDELGTSPRTGNQIINMPKLDWIVNDRNRVAVTYNRMRWASPSGIQTQASNTYGIDSFGNDYVKDDAIIARLTSTITSNMTNEVRYQHGRDFEYENSQSPNPFETPFINNSFGRSPQISIYSSSGITIGKPIFLERGALPNETRNQIADTLTYVHGNHVMKFGEDFNHVNDYISNLYDENGAYTYSTMGDFLADYYHLTQGLGGAGYKPAYSSFTQDGGTRSFAFSTNDYGFFVTDDWKFLPRLTINAGIRYEYQQLPSALLPNPALPQSSTIPSDKNNFGPRVGFAYDLTGDGKTVIRAGYGIYYGRIINGTIFNTLTGSGAAGSQVNYFYRPTTTGAPAFPNILSLSSTGLPASGANVLYFDKHMQNPQVHETDLSVERNVGWNTVVSASYLGSYGRELPNFVDTNLLQSSTISYQVVGGGPIASFAPNGVYTTKLFSRRPCAPAPAPCFGAITDVLSNVNSTYNALALQANHRFSQGLQFNANYTWSHALDFNQNQSTGTATNSETDPSSLRADYGNSNYDVPQRFVANVVYQPTYHFDGWKGYLLNSYSLSPVYQWQNGLPYYLFVGGSASGGANSGINGSGGPSRIVELGRNSYRMPNTSVVDLRLAKSVAIKDKYHVQFAADAFNLFNHQNITSVNNTGYLIKSGVGGGLSTLTYQGAFGSFTNANSNFVYGQRQIQLAARFEF